MNNPFTNNNRRPAIRWWEDARRPCLGRPEFADPSLIRPTTTQTRSMIMRDLASLCRTCPVLTECRAEMLTLPDTEPHGIRAGKIRV